MEAGAQVSVRRVPHTSWRRVLADSFRMFDPRREVHNPMMFVVYVLFIFLIVLTLFPRAFPDIARFYSPSYYLGVTVILFLTLWFAHISEAIAEAQGRAQADSLREIRSGIRARQILPDGTSRWVPSDVLRIGDTVEVQAGEPIPIDGDVIHGAALIDESMMTGESAAVTRESGGDKTSVLGGAHVVQGTVRVRVSAVRGESFLDRLIRLVEGQAREPTPNELALGVFLAALTIALFTVVVTFVYLANFTDIIAIDLATIVALFVCLMPTTIGALLPAIGISGINRVAQANVIAKSGKAVEAAGDLDTLILDKTGTITVGNRLAVQFVAAPDVPMDTLVEGAMLSSSLDDTPEGKSIVRLAARRATPVRRLEQGSFKVLPFTAERRMSGIALADGTEFYKGSIQAIEAYGAPSPVRFGSRRPQASQRGNDPACDLGEQAGRRPRVPEGRREARHQGPDPRAPDDGDPHGHVHRGQPAHRGRDRARERCRRLHRRGETRDQARGDRAREGRRSSRRDERRRLQRRSGPRARGRRAGDEQRHERREGSRQHGRPRQRPHEAHRDRIDR